ncbi:MAG: hypothetical protein FJW38_28545 [Acidobacteria bacterium]|nr:hypothetical protein [Acidobacteriota bacterium]
MRLRVRLTNKDDRSWFRRWWDNLTGAPDPSVDPPAFDKRWIEHAGARYIQRGRNCVCSSGRWCSSYVFDVWMKSELSTVVIEVCEMEAENKGRSRDQRVTESERYSRAVTELTKRIDGGSLAA